MTDAVDERAEAARARDAAAGAAPARDERPSTDARRQNADAQRPAIEVGWVLVGPVEPRVSDAVRQAIERFEAFARERWPGFAWGSASIVRRRKSLELVAEPVALLDLGLVELDAAHWDFAFVITDAELRTHDKPFALGTPARSYGVAVLSTSRLDPAARGERTEREGGGGGASLAERLFALAIHELGHLNDIPHSDAPDDFMFDLKDAPDLDRMRELSAEATATLQERLAEVADLRIEERLQTRSVARFYLHGTWANRWQIVRAVARMRPWSFPLRLSRLTTAALSTMLVFLITAEAWELGMSQRPALVAGLSLLALAATSLYILKRQNLVQRLRAQRFTEQRVLLNVSMIATVLLGMATTYALVFMIALAATQVLFDPRIVDAWASLEPGGPSFGRFMVLSGFIASVAILIGALGASFEAEGYFRHVAIVDEET